MNHTAALAPERDAWAELEDLLLAPLLAITQAMCDTFKKELLQGTHNFMSTGGNNFKCSLYTSNATLSNATTAYTAANEVANGNGYTTGGAALTRVDPANTGCVAFTDFGDLTWTAATITARGALIYNSDKANAAVAVLDFGSDKSSSNGNFTIVFPAADAGNAILRIGP